MKIGMNKIIKLKKDGNQCLREINNSEFLNIMMAILLLLFSNNIVNSQPSGGPYGPISKTYELPDNVSNIYYVSPKGNPNSDGKRLENPTTIETAIAKIKTNDAIILRGGVYRTGNLILNQGIILQPFRDENPVFKGTLVADTWKDLGNGLWTTNWDHLFPSRPQDWWRRHREGKQTPLHKFNNDMVFIDGELLQSKGWEGDVDERSFYIDYETGTIYIGVDPTNKLVEITAFDIAILRSKGEVRGQKSDKKGYILKGITFTQYAYRALEIEGTDPEGLSDESNHGKEVVGTTIENCEISYCSRVAGYFRGDKMTIRNCLISDTSTEGIFILSSNDVLLEKNVIRRNNIERITGYYPAAVKIFNQCYRVTCNDNLVIDHPYSNGIWYDVGNVDGVFTNNWIQDIGNNKTEMNITRPWPSDNGFFFEISKGAVCVGNVFVNCDHGIWVLNSSDVYIYNNTFVNSTACIARNERGAQGDHFGWHPSTGPDVDERDGHVFVNNLLTGDKEFKRPLLYVWQPESICDRVSDPQLNILNNNVYVKGTSNSDDPIIWWSPVSNESCMIPFRSLEGMKKLNYGFSTQSKYLNNYTSPLFISPELSNYKLLKEFEVNKYAKDIPHNISKLLSIQSYKNISVGAYIAN